MNKTYTRRLSLFCLLAMASTSHIAVADGKENLTFTGKLPYNYIVDGMIDHRAKRDGTQTQCDVLTANVRDPQRKAYPVKFGDIKATDAIAACRQALKQDPKNPRLMVNIGRAFNKLKVYDQSYIWSKRATVKV